MQGSSNQVVALGVGGSSLDDATAGSAQQSWWAPVFMARRRRRRLHSHYQPHIRRGIPLDEESFAQTMQRAMRSAPGPDEIQYSRLARAGHGVMSSCGRRPPPAALE